MVVLFEVESWEGGAVLANAAQPWKHPPGVAREGSSLSKDVLCQPVAVLVQAGWMGGRAFETSSQYCFD